MEVLQRSWPWFVILGVIAVIGGILALIHPGFASLVVVVWAAWAFIVLGVGQLVHATVIRAWGGFLMTALMGILALLLGASLLLNPLAGVVSLTALLGAMFLVYGIAKVVVAFNIRSSTNWTWLLLSGLISILLAVLIFSDFQQSASSLLGILLGVELLFYGFALLMTGMALRSRVGGNR
ncbi:DUF308 domain-containing protein [Labrys neptuniae]|uniref:HdeD family acid-resistance protein n=1 Tax=Labrys neptuniae TaxID=376174 RepID=UPI00288FDA26|nr:DUF308 domain-containing protein [Labrys neptuniae]MDT3378017.1 DUF308 domain-containing protein [Labrys neptuniae]